MDSSLSMSCSLNWRGLLPVRITEKELIVYGFDVRKIAGHELYPSGTTGEKLSLQEHAPGRDHHQIIRTTEGALYGVRAGRSAVFR